MVHETQEKSAQNKEITGQLEEQARNTKDVTQNVDQRVMQLARSSEDIKEIVNVIEKIAEETDLLALNAAIESAKAGEEGKSFGVVAHEIKNLSLSTTESIVKIKEIINMILEEVAATRKGMNELTERDKDKVYASAAQLAEMSQEYSAISEEIVSCTEEGVMVNKNILAGAEILAKTADALEDSLTDYQF